MTPSERWADKAPKVGQKIFEFTGNMEDYRVGSIYETARAPLDMWKEIGIVWAVRGNCCHMTRHEGKPTLFLWAFHDGINGLHKWENCPDEADFASLVGVVLDFGAADTGITGVKEKVTLPAMVPRALCDKAMEDAEPLKAYCNQRWPGAVSVFRDAAAGSINVQLSTQS